MRRPRWRNVSLRHPLTRSGAANEKAPAQAHGAEILNSGESFVHLRGSLHLQCFDLNALARTRMTGGLWLRTTLPDAGSPAKSALVSPRRAELAERPPLPRDALRPGLDPVHNPELLVAAPLDGDVIGAHRPRGRRCHHLFQNTRERSGDTQWDGERGTRAHV